MDVKGKAYKFWWCFVTEKTNTGKAMIASASGGVTPGEVVDWSDPHAERVVQWASGCVNSPPTVPAAKPTSDAYALLSSEVSGLVPEPIVGTGMGYFMSGIYRYGVVNPREVDAVLPLGMFPLDYAPGGAAQEIPANVFQQLLSWAARRL